MKKFKIALLAPLHGWVTLLAKDAQTALDGIHDMTGCKVKVMEVTPLCKCSDEEQQAAEQAKGLEAVILERNTWQPVTAENYQEIMAQMTGRALKKIAKHISRLDDLDK
jgi:hypothetical protein